MNEHLNPVFTNILNNFSGKTMKPIKREDIIEELDKVKNHQELTEVLKKYPTRIHVTLKFSIDSDHYALGGNWSLDNYTGLLDAEER
jgi:hypothetical protein